MLERRVAWAVAITAMLTMTVSYIDRSTLAALAPTVTAALDMTETQYGWLGSLFAVAYLVATPLGGWWIDRLGARRGLARSLLAWSIVAALHALVPTFAALLLLRVALGLAEGPGFPGATQTVHRVLPDDDRARGFGLLFVGSSIGMAIAPQLASVLDGTLGWRGAFIGTAAVGLAWIPLWLALTNRRDVRARLDAAPPPRARDRQAWRELARDPHLARALVGIFAVAPALTLVTAWGAKFLTAAFAVKQGDMGHYLWLPPLALDAGALAFGDLAARLRGRNGAPGAPRGLNVIAGALAVTIALWPLAASPWQAMALAATTMAGGGALYTLVTVELLARMPADRVALAGGLLAGAQSVAQIVVNPLIGAAVDRWHDYTVTSVALGIWVVPGTVIWLLWRPRNRIESAP